MRSRPSLRSTPTPPPASPMIWARCDAPSTARDTRPCWWPMWWPRWPPCRSRWTTLGVDVAVGASQKGLMCPPGIGFVAVNAPALAAAERNLSPRFYWDWVRRKQGQSYRKFCGTPPQNLLLGLEAALGLIFSEGLDAVWRRHAHLARAVQAAVEGWREGGALGFLRPGPGQPLGFGHHHHGGAGHRRRGAARGGARPLPGGAGRRPRAR